MRPWERPRALATRGWPRGRGGLVDREHPLHAALAVPGDRAEERVLPGRELGRDLDGALGDVVALLENVLVLVLEVDVVGDRRGILVSEGDRAGRGLQAVRLEAERAVLGGGHVEGLDGPAPDLAARGGRGLLLCRLGRRGGSGFR